VEKGRKDSRDHPLHNLTSRPQSLSYGVFGDLSIIQELLDRGVQSKSILFGQIEAFVLESKCTL